MSVEPWMLACPRKAITPLPGRPTLPISSCRMAAVRMNWAPSVCWVQPVAYPKQVVRSRPELSAIDRATYSKSAMLMPHMSRTISGV